MAYREEAPLAFEPRTGSGVSATMINFGDQSQIAVYIKVDNASSLNLRIYVEDSPDGVDWFQVDYMVISGNGNHTLRINKPTADNLRIRYQVASGSASFGVSVAAA